MNAPAMTPPTRYALVPRTCSEAMYEAVESPGTIQQSWDRCLAASPNAGRVTAEMLERAAKAHALSKRRRLGGAPFPPEIGDLEDMSAALRSLGILVQPGATVGTALGLQVDAPAGEVVDAGKKKPCPLLGPSCRGCPDCQGIPFDQATADWAAEELALLDQEEAERAEFAGRAALREREGK